MTVRKRSSTDRVLDVLSLFTEERPAWTVEMLIAELNTTRATTYRYVKSLYDAGFLAPSAGSSYVLGPRFIQVDRQIQRSDPLLRAARPEIARDCSPLIGAKVVSSFYGDQVLSVHVEKLDHDIRLIMERGQPFPLLFGSPSKIILAYLPPYQMKNFYQSNEREIRDRQLGESWADFRNVMRQLRKEGVCVGGHIERSVIGVAAPIFHAKGSVSSSLCYVRRKEICTDADIAALGDMVKATAARISLTLQSGNPEQNGKSNGMPAPRMPG